MFIMADREDQLKLTSNEIKKFRKKLRQIERLEELDRDLSEEELLKVRMAADGRLSRSIDSFYCCGLFTH